MKKIGVNLITDRNGGLGILTAAERVKRALTASRVAHVWIDVSEVSKIRFDTNLIHVNPESVVELLDQNPTLREQFNVGYWNWEMPEFPYQWIPALEWIDGVIAPSTFTAQSLKAVLPVPLKVVPYCIDNQVAPDIRRYLGISRKEFLFYYTFDGRSFPERKNPLAVLEGFALIQRRYPLARLLIKCVHFEEIEAGLKGDLMKVKNSPGVFWIDGFRSTAFMNSLMRTCDAYVSLHGSEGWGLSIMDAFSRGKPTILTHYSAVTDYANRSNAILLSPTFVPLRRSSGPYALGAPVASVSSAQAARAMSRLLESPELCKRLSIAAKRTACRYSDAAVGRQLIKALSAIKVEPKRTPHPLFTTDQLRGMALRQVWGSPRSANWRTLVLRRGLYSLVNRLQFRWHREGTTRLERLYSALTPPSS